MSAAEVRSTGPASKTGDVRSRTFQFVTTLGAGRHKRRKAQHLTMTFESGRTDMSSPLQASVGKELAADLLDTVLTSLDDSKAEDAVTLDIAGKSSLADHMVIASGTSNRHVKALADNVIDAAKKAEQPPIGSEGEDSGEWILVDLGDVIVHVMLPATREFYDLERLWQNPDHHPDRNQDKDA